MPDAAVQSVQWAIDVPHVPSLEMPSSLGMAIQFNARYGREAEKVHKIWDKTTGTLQPPRYIGEGHVLRFSTVLRERKKERAQ